MPKKKVDELAAWEARDTEHDREIAERYEKDLAKAASAAKLLKRTWFTRDAGARRKTKVPKRRK